MEDLELIAEDLEKNATVFQKSTKNLKDKKRWENNKMKIIIGASVSLAVLLIIIVIILSV